MSKDMPDPEGSATDEEQNTTTGPEDGTSETVEESLRQGSPLEGNPVNVEKAYRWGEERKRIDGVESTAKKIERMEEIWRSSTVDLFERACEGVGYFEPEDAFSQILRFWHSRGRIPPVKVGYTRSSLQNDDSWDLRFSGYQCGSDYCESRIRPHRVKTKTSRYGYYFQCPKCGKWQELPEWYE